MQTAGHDGVRDDSGNGTMQPSIREVTLESEGEYWTVSFGGLTVRLRDTRGIRYLACLLRAPGRDVRCEELVVAVTDPGAAAAPRAFSAQPLRSERLEHTRELSDRGPTLDTRAKAEYRRRLAELAADLEEAERFNDMGRVECLRAEAELLERQLAAAVGLGGQDRPGASSAERARIAVGKRIRAAIRQIATHHSPLGRHLSTTVRTGQLCSYRPELDRSAS